MTAATLPIEEAPAETFETNAPITSSLLGTYKRAPMEFVRGEGVELIDADGRRYLDFSSGIAVTRMREVRG
jgi:acetylornithine/succinyldiaminopimelate/putrescine aminotransferase